MNEFENEQGWRKAAWMVGWLSVILIVGMMFTAFMSLQALEMLLLLFCGIFVAQYYLHWKAFLKKHDRPKPLWLKNTIEAFWTLLVMFIVHGFLVEPMIVPTGSLLPTVELGDRILVEKSAYDVKLPVLNIVLWERRDPQRGEIVAFINPLDRKTVYVKRVAAVGGDTLSYNFKTKQLVLNGVPTRKISRGSHMVMNPINQPERANRYVEYYGQVPHVIEEYPNVSGMPLKDMQPTEGCQYAADSLTCKVPAGHYYMLGDNRDASFDSRFFGFVPRAYLLGEANYVFFNTSDWSRSGRALSELAGVAQDAK